jgi:EAL domain-containing protein (putative c-di-GMP-specific phosphodiesterase class I)
MQTVLIVDDDPIIGEGLSMALEKPGREMILCRDLESAQLIVERLCISCVVSDVRLTGPFRFEGLDFIHYVNTHSPESVIVLMTGAATEELTTEALARGATAVLSKPFEVAALEALIGDPCSYEQSRLTTMPSIDEIASSAALVPWFQPIVDLSAGQRAYGFESLARFDDDSILRFPDALFAYAARTGKIVDLELACIRSTFARCAPLTRDGAKIFVNIHPAVVGNALLAATLDEMVVTSGIAAAQVVLEITEQQSLGEARAVAAECGALRARGFSFALDDVGIAYSHLAHIDAIAPLYLKVSQEFGGSFERDATKTKIVRNMLSLARAFGCQLVLEGIETAATRDAARDEGITLAQGYFFGHPAPAPDDPDERRSFSAAERRTMRSPTRQRGVNGGFSVSRGAAT